MASSHTNSYGSGGMLTKIQAAEIAGSYGCNTLIFQGNIENPLKNLKKNDKGSLFISSEKKKEGNEKLVSRLNKYFWGLRNR